MFDPTSLIIDDGGSQSSPSVRNRRQAASTDGENSGESNPSSASASVSPRYRKSPSRAVSNGFAENDSCNNNLPEIAPRRPPRRHEGSKAFSSLTVDGFDDEKRRRRSFPVDADNNHNHTASNDNELRSTSRSAFSTSPVNRFPQGFSSVTVNGLFLGSPGATDFQTVVEQHHHQQGRIRNHDAGELLPTTPRSGSHLRAPENLYVDCPLSTSSSTPSTAGFNVEQFRRLSAASGLVDISFTEKVSQPFLLPSDRASRLMTRSASATPTPLRRVGVLSSSVDQLKTTSLSTNCVGSNRCTPRRQLSEVIGSTAVGDVTTVSSNCGQTIVCKRCGLCRCDLCTGRRRRKRPLPSLWCGRRCGLWSADRAVECVTCVCLVQAADYHCSSSLEDDDVGGRNRKKEKPAAAATAAAAAAAASGGGKSTHLDDDEDDSSESNPCSCTGSDRPRCRRRWLCLACLTAVGCLPCLLLYWPLKAGLAAVRALYSMCVDARHRRRGCRCGRLERSQQQRSLSVSADNIWRVDGSEFILRQNSQKQE